MLDVVAEFETLVSSLAARGLEYAVCGGFAVIIHGHVRASLQGLARMKRLAGRHQDLADLENLGLGDESAKR